MNREQCKNLYREIEKSRKEAIETVLNLLEKKDIDIIEIKEANRQLSIELQKKDKQIEQYQNILATNDMLHVKECEKKDKIINEQIDYIYSFLHGHLDYISNDIAGNKKKLKQYFERKVENGN